ncbi:MAG: flagellar biosynthesis anti-sigma factor FlgM [Pirellulales bacterium]|nr:flagellar biosynthesis anti-sigma factor FlgM [Pirellulales bacterium]
MQIYGTAHLHGPQGIGTPHINTRSGGTTGAASGIDTRDTLEISSQGLYAEKLGNLPDIRADRVNAIRQQIASGTYETDDKLDAALDRLLDELA